MTKLSFDPKSHKYFWGKQEVPSVTQVIASVGLYDFSHVSEAVLEQSADFGNKVHEMTALADRGELDVFGLDPFLDPYLTAWEKFRKEMGFEPDPNWIEAQRYSEKYGYAGTPDRVGLIQGKDFAIVDIKTGVLTAAAAIQTAGYELLCPFKVKRRMSVQLKDDGTYKIAEYKDKSDKLVFLSCLNVANFKRREGK